MKKTKPHANPSKILKAPSDKNQIKKLEELVKENSNHLYLLMDLPPNL